MKDNENEIVPAMPEPEKPVSGPTDREGQKLGFEMSGGKFLEDPLQIQKFEDIRPDSFMTTETKVREVLNGRLSDQEIDQIIVRLNP